MLKIYPEKEYPEAVDFCRRFVGEKTRPRYVMGRNEYAVSIARRVDLDGFIDDFTQEMEFLGKPILKMDDVPKDSLVVSAVIFVVPLTAMKKLQARGLESLDYFRFLKYSGLALKEISFLTESRRDLENHFEKYQWVYQRLEDSASRKILMNLVNFRASGDLHYMLDFEDRREHQYFEDFFEWGDGEVFVDAGGYDGLTSLAFIQRCPKYRSIHFFEPDSRNLELARKNLSEHPRIYYYRMGLADGRQTLRFCSGGGSASKISRDGDVEINVEALDDLIQEKISFIKMDIEGAEEAALSGAKNHIANDHPRLAVCCYHRVEDLWKIPEQIMAVRNDYRLYLRHYTDGLHETVMYFIPVKN
ncbi:MAG TPA: FkbM family methyltransferase [Smithella sp.]|nr:FkbM family methyltransferase [Smithella sp.]